VSGTSRVLHIRTGNAAFARRLDTWLERYGAHWTGLDDAFDACVHLIRHYSDPPDLILIGADWLAPDETVLFRFCRETWPSAAILAYAESPSAASHLRRVTEPHAKCLSDTELQVVLGEAPVSAAERIRREAASVVRRTLAADTSASPRAIDSTNGVSGRDVVADAIERRSASRQNGDAAPGRRALPGGDVRSGSSGCAAAGFLTPEELHALTDDAED
jgi:hypothetical protein